MIKISILIPVCSRNCNFTDIKDTYFYNTLYPSFLKTKEDGYEYIFYIGIDDDDEFYLKNQEYFSDLGFRIIKLKDCQHAPAIAWNQLYEEAMKDKTISYFYQLADDIELITEGWTTSFIKELDDMGGYGIVGPVDEVNYQQRVNGNTPLLLENIFVSRKHFEIFGFLFHPEVKNWYCDQLISDIYRKKYCKFLTNFKIKNKIRDVRYNILVDDNLKNNYSNYVFECKQILQEYMKKKVFSFCIYGTNSKYLDGLVENIENINKNFPSFYIYIYGGYDVPIEYKEKYKSYSKVVYYELEFNDLQLMYYRFFPIDDPEITLMICRDADSNINERDRWCITQFMSTNKSFHIIRDHEHHSLRIMGGMWAIKKGAIKNKIESMYHIWKENHLDILTNYRSDQLFLEEVIYPKIKNDVLIHSDYNFYNDENVSQILVYDNGVNFVGNVIEDNKYVFTKLKKSQSLYKISVIINSNNFDLLLNTLESVYLQTYPVHEIIVINNKNNYKRYHTYRNEKVKIINIKSDIEYNKLINYAIDISTGDFISFVNENVLWLPHKLFLQVQKLELTGNKISSTDGLFCLGDRWTSYNLKNKLIYGVFETKYPAYNQQYYMNTFLSMGILTSVFPDIWTKSFLCRHNFVVEQSILIERNLLIEMGKYNYDDKWHLWLNCLDRTNLCYVKTPCFVYYNS
jgi:hypothetical protein